MKDRVLGDFRLKGVLGQGGGGVVYLAEQLTLGRDAVVKIVRSERDEGAIDRFLREARLASQFDHPFAAHVYDFGHESDGVLWLAMEFVRGSTLDEIIRSQGPVSLARFVPFFERVCEVVQAAHEQGIVHRDIKPANVMVINRAGRLLPKLLDFGIGRREGQRGLGLAEAPALLDDALEPTTPLERVGDELERTLVERLTQADTSNLTQAGAVIGTPQYMSPEQWVDASTADSLSDLYSLALLAYQALTAKPAFKAKSMRALFRAHVEEPLPLLPDGLPAALHEVLAKAAAKKPADRYESVGAFAIAFRAASGLTVEGYDLPRISDDVRENVMSEAPQPLAEAVAMIDSARTPKQQLEAVGVACRVLIRYIALLALAARSRIGPGRAADAPAVTDLCRTLATGRLLDGEWLELATELCRPFQHQQAVHPLPDLVGFFFRTDEATDASKVARLLIEKVSSVPDKAADADIFTLLMSAVPALSQLLSGLHFIFDYSLVVARNGAERWMGARRTQRVPQKGFRHDAAIAEGTVLVLDGEGLPILTLSPLVEVLSPGPGLGEELFMLDGEGRHGARMVSLPGSFERQHPAVWLWFEKTMTGFTAAAGAQREQPKAPFKGLSTFTFEDADNYFGREREAESFANRLRVSHLLAVVGPSGSGKSSFVLAGVLPLLPEGCRPVVMRPGARPFESFRDRLCSTGRGVGADADHIVAELRDGESLLIVVDQFEELVTLCVDPAQREQFAALLVGLADHPSGRIRVVLTLRDDFLIRVQTLGPLRERFSGALQLLSTPQPEDLLRVVSEPLKRVGFTFDDPSLPATMVKEVSEYPGALALLSFTASQLWELRDRHLQQLRSQTYQALGGVGGALAHHAEVTLAAMSDDERKLVREAFRHLVTSSMTRAVMSRQEVTDVLGGEAVATAVLDKLITARLLVASEEANHDDRIEVIHEALIVSWPRLVSWLREDAETARLRDSLRASARQWGDRGRPSGLLWRKETLAEYRVWRARFVGRLTQLEEAFAEASLRDDARAARLRNLTVGAIVAGLLVGIFVLYRSNEESKANAQLAQQRASESQTRLLNLWQEQGRLAMVAGKPMEALVYSRAAKSLGAAGSALNRVMTSARRALDGSEGVLAALDARVTRLVVSDDHRWLVATTPIETVLLSLEETGSPRGKRWPKRCTAAAFTADSRRLLVVCNQTATVVQLATLEEHEQPLPCAFHELYRTRQGRFVGAEIGDTIYELSDTGEATKLFRVPGALSLHAKPAPDGLSYVFPGYSSATAESPHALLAVDEQGQVIWRSTESPHLIGSVTVDPDTLDVAISRADGTIAVFDRQHRLRWEQRVGFSKVTALAFGSGSVLFVQPGGLLGARDVATGEPRFQVIGAPTGITNVAFSRGADAIFVGGADGVLRKVDALSGGLVFSHHGHHDSVNVLMVVDDHVYTGGQDGTIRRWNAKTPVVDRLTDEVVVNAGSVDGFYAATETTLVTVAVDGGVVTGPRPALSIKGGLFDVWASASSTRSFFTTDKGVEAFDRGRSVWSVAGNMALGSVDGFGARVAYALFGEGLQVVDLNDGGVVHVQPALEGSNDVLLLDHALLATDNGDLMVVELNQPDRAIRVKAHGSPFRFSRTSHRDIVLSFGNEHRIFGWATNDLKHPLFQVSEVPTAVVAADVSADLKTLFVLLGDGRLVTYDIDRGLMLAQAPLTPMPNIGAVNAAAGTVVFQDPQGRMVRVNLPHLPAFQDDAELDAFLKTRVPLRLDAEELVYLAPQKQAQVEGR